MHDDDRITRATSGIPRRGRWNPLRGFHPTQSVHKAAGVAIVAMPS